MKFQLDKRKLSNIIFSSRWLLYPINIGLLLILTMYIGVFIVEDIHFLMNGFKANLESLMILMLGFVDAAMVANLIIMIVQGGHQIFIQKFEQDKKDLPQYLDHIDTGILKVKIALSIASITLVQLLKDFVHLEKLGWELVSHKLIIHVVALLSALIVAIIWRITHSDKKDVG